MLIAKIGLYGVGGLIGLGGLAFLVAIVIVRNSLRRNDWS